MPVPMVIGASARGDGSRAAEHTEGVGSEGVAEAGTGFLLVEEEPRGPEGSAGSRTALAACLGDDVDGPAASSCPTV